MDITAEFRGLSFNLRDLYQELSNNGWQVKKIKYDSGSNKFIATGQASHGEELDGWGPNEQQAISNLLLNAIHRNGLRMTRVAMWSTNFTHRLEEVAKEYAKAPVYEPKAAIAFHELGRDAEKRAETLGHHLDIRVTNNPEPYEHAEKMCEDIRKRRKLEVSAAGIDHPIWSKQQALAFRIAFDVLGYCASGGDWGWEGTNQAFAAYVHLIPEEAQKALFTQVIGQTAYVSFYRAYGPQKIALFPKFMDSAQDKENPHDGYSGVHPSQSFAPLPMPRVNVSAITIDHSNGFGYSPMAEEPLDQPLNPRTATTLPKSKIPISQMTPEQVAEYKAAQEYARIGSLKWLSDNPRSPDHIVNHWNQTTPEHRAQGISWYADAHNAAKQIAQDRGITVNQAAGLIANYSPQQHWATNLEMASRAAAGEVIGGPKQPGQRGFMASRGQADVAARILNGEDYHNIFRGKKITSFGHLIEHGQDTDVANPAVVIDRHALGVAHGGYADDGVYTHSKVSSGVRKDGSSPVYDDVANMYRQAADIINANGGHNGVPIQPHQLQAATWLTRQRLNAEGGYSDNSDAVANRTRKVSENATRNWNAYAGENHPALVGKTPGTGFSAQTGADWPASEQPTQLAPQPTQLALASFMGNDPLPDPVLPQKLADTPWRGIEQDESGNMMPTALHDPNEDWESGIEPLPQNAYMHHGDPIQAQETRNTAQLIDTEWAYLNQNDPADLARMKQAIVNAFRVVILSPRKKLQWNAIHYQDISGIPGDESDPNVYWDTLERARQNWNVQRYGEDVRYQHLPYYKQQKKLEQLMYQARPKRGQAEAVKRAASFVNRLRTRIEQNLMQEDEGKPEDQRRFDRQIENKAGYIMSDMLKAYIKEHQPGMDVDTSGLIRQATALEQTQENQQNPDMQKYGAFLGTHLKAISQVSKYVDVILKAALYDVHQKDGTGYHFRATVMQLNIPQVGPKVASFAWLLLQPMTSELGTIDTHMMDVLGHNFDKDMNNRDYFKFERELRAGRDAAGYSHIPLGQFQWGMWDYKRTGPGSHQDHSAMKILDPLPHDQVDWAEVEQPINAQQAEAHKLNWQQNPPDWWAATLPARQQVAQDFDQKMVSPNVPMNRIPYNQGAPPESYEDLSNYTYSKVSVSQLTPYFVHPQTGQRVVGQPGQTIAQHATAQGLTLEQLWQLEDHQVGKT